VPFGAGEHSQTLPTGKIVRRVLIAEDDPALRNLIADVFAFEGYFVTEAGDDRTFLLAATNSQQVREEEFDLMVLGIQERGSIDIETLARARNIGVRTPAIILASCPKSQLARQLEELDATLLGKPFALENLRVVANHVIHARQCGFSQLA
jgi:two-component system response regulator (stage 0 sporulation protein F)